MFLLPYLFIKVSTPNKPISSPTKKPSIAQECHPSAARPSYCKDPSLSVPSSRTVWLCRDCLLTTFYHIQSSLSICSFRCLALGHNSGILKCFYLLDFVEYQLYTALLYQARQVVWQQGVIADSDSPPTLRNQILLRDARFIDLSWRNASIIYWRLTIEINRKGRAVSVPAFRIY